MTHTSWDYRKGGPPRPHKRREPPGTRTFWFLFGCLVGASGIAAGSRIADYREGQVSAPGTSPAELASTVDQPVQQYEFDFRELLANDEVMVPLEPERPRKPALP
jgi:hypothetical protein